MGRALDWRTYVDEHGDFELATYLYRVILSLMKHSLDMGTLLSTDPVRLRAYKEQTKSIFKSQWLEVAQALESFDIIVPCGCSPDEYCKICGGSRYRLNSALSPDELREISMVVSDDGDPELARKLQEGLTRALREYQEWDGVTAGRNADGDAE